jgi:hypothetical protein
MARILSFCSRKYLVPITPKFNPPNEIQAISLKSCVATRRPTVYRARSVSAVTTPIR